MKRFLEILIFVLLPFAVVTIFLLKSRASMEQAHRLTMQQVAMTHSNMTNRKIDLINNVLVTNLVNSTEETDLSRKIKARDGTNYLGTYMGMIAEWDGYTNQITFDGHPKKPPYQGVMMFSATSGELLKWISYEDFKAIFVDKTRPEYPNP